MHSTISTRMGNPYGVQLCCTVPTDFRTPHVHHGTSTAMVSYAPRLEMHLQPAGRMYSSCDVSERFDRACRMLVYEYEHSVQNISTSTRYELRCTG